MKEFWTMTRTIFTFLGGWLGYFWGGCDWLMIALTAFVIADYVTGVMCAIVEKKLSSEVGFKDIFKKVLIFMLVGITHLLDVHIIGSGGNGNQNTIAIECIMSVAYSECDKK